MAVLAIGRNRPQPSQSFGIKQGGRRLFPWRLVLVLLRIQISKLLRRGRAGMAGGAGMAGTLSEIHVRGVAR